jgi:Domain of unknown function (DUF4926)
MAKTSATYRELEMIAIPEDIPELGIEAGTMGTIATVYEDGQMLDVEVSREDGATIGFVDLKVAEDGSLSVVAFTPFDSP